MNTTDISVYLQIRKVSHGLLLSILPSFLPSLPLPFLPPSLSPFLLVFSFQHFINLLNNRRIQALLLASMLLELRLFDVFLKVFLYQRLWVSTLT